MAMILRAFSLDALEKRWGYESPTPRQEEEEEEEEEEKEQKQD